MTMTDGISVGNIGGVTINGIRCGLVSDVACDHASDDAPDIDGSIVRLARMASLTPDEARIAGRACAFLQRMRAAGYSKEDTRKAFVRKIVDEAQRVKPTASEQGDSGGA